MFAFIGGDRADCSGEPICLAQPYFVDPVEGAERRPGGGGAAVVAGPSTAAAHGQWTGRDPADAA